jgi:hypothetical protein
MGKSKKFQAKQQPKKQEQNDEDDELYVTDNNLTAATAIDGLLSNEVRSNLALFSLVSTASPIILRDIFELSLTSVSSC